MHTTANSQTVGAPFKLRILQAGDVLARELWIHPEDFDGMVEAYRRHGWTEATSVRPLSRRHVRMWRHEGGRLEKRYLIEWCAPASEAELVAPDPDGYPEPSGDGWGYGS